MGLFGKKEICSICNRVESKVKLSNGCACQYCMNMSAAFLPAKKYKDVSVEEVRKALFDRQENCERLQQFTVTQKVSPYIEFDDNHRWWLLPDGLMGKKKNPKVFQYSDIISYELLEDGAPVIANVRQEVKSLQIKITVNNINCPMVYMPLICTHTKKNSMQYKFAMGIAQEILAILSVVSVDRSNGAENIRNTSNISNADEIVRFKELLDAGIITREEFEAKKKQLLGL